jgi:hypothetical protein
MQDADDGFLGEPHVSAEGLLSRFAEPLAALLALVPLDLVAALTGLHRFASA